MATEIDTIITRFETDAANAIAGLLQLRAAQEAANKSQAEGGGAAKKASKEVKVFGDTMRDFARGQRRDAAVARYYVNELAAVVPVSGMAKDALSAFAAGLAGGGGFALALELATFGVRAFSGALRANAAEQEAAKKRADDHAVALTKVVDGWRDYAIAQQAAELGGAAKKFLQDQITLGRDLAGVTVEQADLEYDKLDIQQRQGRLDLENSKHAQENVRLVGKLGDVETKLIATKAKRVEIEDKMARNLREYQGIGAPVDYVSEALKLADKQRKADEDAAEDRARTEKQREKERVEVANRYRAAWLEGLTDNQQAALAASNAYHEHVAALDRNAYSLSLTSGDERAAVELERLYQEYRVLLASEALSQGQREELIGRYEQRKNEIIGKSESDRTEREKKESDKRKQIAQDEAAQKIRTVIAEAQAVADIFLAAHLAAWSRAGTENRRFTAEYAKLSKERRANDLLESGVARTVAEANRMAAQEAQAAEQAKRAAEKQAQADRMAGLAEEYAIRALGELAGRNFYGAAAFGVAAAAAATFARKLGKQAEAMQQNRGFTADENDTLRDLRGESGSRYGSGSNGSSEKAAPVVQVYFTGKAYVTEAEVQRAVADAVNGAKAKGWTN
jgi:hypothetical protein